MDEQEKKCLADIEEYGCHVLHIMEDTEEGYPQFTYSVGIQESSGMPEVIVVGLRYEMGTFIVNEYNRLIREGETFNVDQFYDDFLEGFEVTFQRVDKAKFRDHLNWDIWLYDGLEFDALQLVYPSTKGVWPWAVDAHPDFLWFQRNLGSGESWGSH